MSKTRIVVAALALLFVVASADAATIHVSKAYAGSADLGGGVYQTPNMGYARYIASWVSTDTAVTDEIIVEDSSTYYENDGDDGNFHFENAGPIYLHAAEGAHPVFNADVTAANAILILKNPTDCVIEGITFTTNRVFMDNGGSYNESMLMCGDWANAYTAPIVRDCIFISTKGHGCISYASGGVEATDAVEIDHCAFYFSGDGDKIENRDPIHWNSGCYGNYDIDQSTIVMNNCNYVGCHFPGGTLITFTNSIITNVQEWGAFTSPTTNMIDRCFLSYMGSWSGNFPSPDTNLPAGHDGGVFADPVWAGDPAAGNFMIQSPSPCAFSGADNIGYDIWTTSGATPTVPDVSGMTQTEATTALEDAGYVVTVEQEASDTIPAGTIIRTEPAIGSELAEGETVTLVVSTGSASTDLPVAGLFGLMALGGAIGLGGTLRIRRRR